MTGFEFFLTSFAVVIVLGTVLGDLWRDDRR